MAWSGMALSPVVDDPGVLLLGRVALTDRCQGPNRPSSAASKLEAILRDIGWDGSEHAMDADTSDELRGLLSGEPLATSISQTCRSNG